jgi:molecular chaperone GrpE
MTPPEREGPSEGAVRAELREEPGPRASSSPGEGREQARSDGGRGERRGPERAGAAGVDPATDGAPDEPLADPSGGDGATAGEAPAGPDGDATAPSGDPLADAERQRDEYLALAQRTQADFENYRRRAARDAAAAGARAKAGLVRELLPAIDNLERAIAAAADGADDGFARGIQMVHGELVGALERSGVAAFEPTGEAFDPTVHEAISTRPADGTEPGVVLEVVEKGYRLDETVLRPARVVVSA